MKRTISLFIIVALIISCAFTLPGCSGSGSKEYPVSYGDATISQEPQSIVVLNDSVADIIAYIGYHVKMAGRAVSCDQDYLRVVPSVGTSNNPAIDTIVQVGADLVIADSTLPDKIREKIEAQGIQVITMDRAGDLQSLEKQYSDIGAILGGNETGKKKGQDSYKSLFDMLSQFKTATTGVVKTTAYLYLDDSGALCSFTKGSLEQKIFNYNGTINALSHQETPQVNATDLRLGSPTYIFYDDEKVLEYLSNDEQLMNLGALREGRTYQLPLKKFYRQGVSFEKTVYEMIDYLNAQDQSTPDQQ